MTGANVPDEEPSWGADGLLPAVVQDATDGRVLMLAWMDAEAWGATRSTGVAHFHSRSRGRLWRKGETSGNELRVREVALDCDRDAILLTVDPTGPTCHRGTRSCFDGEATAEGPDPGPQGFAWLETLWTTIDRRARDRPDDSYTTRLLDAGVDATGRKVVEEATEVLIAAKDDAAVPLDGDHAATLAALAEETADLVYHALVVLAGRETTPAAVIDVLRRRHRG